METQGALLPRYGVHSVLDTPRLVTLDQRLEAGEDRQAVYKGEITEDGVVSWLEAMGIPRAGSGDGAEEKDEL